MGNKRSSSRKRPRPTPEENRQVYYDRLVYKCRKELHKQIKVCKTFETKKIIRKLKEQPSETQQERLDQLKGTVSLDPIIDECFRRLGIVQLDPSFGKEKPSPPTEDETKDAKTKPIVEPWIIEKIMQHKKMRDSLEQWNDEVTSYRRWILREQDRREGRRSEASSKKANTTSPKQQQHNRRAEKEAKELNSSLFVRLGNASEDDEDGDDIGENDGGAAQQYPDGNYGPASRGGFNYNDTMQDQLPKKNRPGQRARKAKAQAIEARREGRVLPKSINWRPKKQHPEATSDEWTGSSSALANAAHASKDSITNKPAAEPDTSLHPSWQARKAQASGIVAFQGKKITF